MREVLQNVAFALPTPSGTEALYVRDSASVAGAIGSEPIYRVEEGARASFGSYFNGFPAAYWAKWTDVRDVRLELGIVGDATVEVRASDARGLARTLETVDVDEHAMISCDVDLDGFREGGWLWFEVVGRAGGAVIRSGRWTTAAAAVREVRPLLGIPTFNKPDFCARTLTRLSEHPRLLDELAGVLVVDQGDALVEDDADAREALDRLGSRARVIRQQNLGGSGGFARVMLTALRERARGVVLVDDDVEIEPESIRRAITFARYTRHPTIVGSHMIDLAHPTRLHAWAEVIDEEPFMWRPVDGTDTTIDLASFDLADPRVHHARVDADFNGWWLALVPDEVMEKTGMPLPAFIKWDDAEYSLRARANGFPTVTLPGVAVWHLAWTGKTDQTDWQAFFHARNRILTALLHSSAPRGGSVLTHSRRVDLKLFASMQYAAVAVRHAALRSILAGPDLLHGSLASARQRAGEVRRDYPDATPLPADGLAAPGPAHPSPEPRGVALVARVAWSVVSQLFRNGDVRDTQRNILSTRTPWWELTRYNGATVIDNASGIVHVYRRDRVIYRRQLRESVKLHRAIRRHWGLLSERYRAADLTSPTAWETTLRGEQ